MKQIKINKKIEQKEQSAELRKQAEREAMGKALDELRKSTAYVYVLKFFKEYEDKIIDEIQSIQSEELKKVFMLSKKKQAEKIEEMSKRDAVLTGVLAILKRVKNKL